MNVQVQKVTLSEDDLSPALKRLAEKLIKNYRNNPKIIEMYRSRNLAACSVKRYIERELIWAKAPYAPIKLESLQTISENTIKEQMTTLIQKVFPKQYEVAMSA